jgi:hypothetical protein
MAFFGGLRALVLAGALALGLLSSCGSNVNSAFLRQVSNLEARVRNVHPVFTKELDSHKLGLELKKRNRPGRLRASYITRPEGKDMISVECTEDYETCRMEAVAHELAHRVYKQVDPELLGKIQTAIEKRLEEPDAKRLMEEIYQQRKDYAAIRKLAKEHLLPVHSCATMLAETQLEKSVSSQGISLPNQGEVTAARLSYLSAMPTCQPESLDEAYGPFIEAASAIREHKKNVKDAAFGGKLEGLMEIPLIPRVLPDPREDMSEKREQYRAALIIGLQTAGANPAARSFLKTIEDKYNANNVVFSRIYKRTAKRPHDDLPEEQFAAAAASLDIGHNGPVVGSPMYFPLNEEIVLLLMQVPYKGIKVYEKRGERYFEETLGTPLVTTRTIN